MTEYTFTLNFFPAFHPGSAWKVSSLGSNAELVVVENEENFLRNGKLVERENQEEIFRQSFSETNGRINELLNTIEKIKPEESLIVDMSNFWMRGGKKFIPALEQLVERPGETRWIASPFAMGHLKRMQVSPRFIQLDDHVFQEVFRKKKEGS